MKTKLKTKNSKLKTSPAPRLSVRNAYEAGSTGRRLKIWQPGRVGPNDSVLRDLSILRDRSRDSVRNNAWIKKGVNSWVSNEIGTGIIPRAISSNQDFNKACDALWERWTKFADADGILEFHGMTSLSTRTRLQAGELFWRRRLRSPDDGLPVPLQFQLLEPDFCPITHNQFFQPGRRIRAGIEFDGIGRRRAYWMYKSHPGDSFFFSDGLDLVPVPAPTVFHHYAPLRPGQIRGVPWTIQSLIKSHDFDEYDDAELIRKKNRASYTGVIRRQNYGEDDYKFDPFTGESLERDKNEVPMMNVEPGSMPALLPGEDITMFDGDTSGSGYSDFVRQQLLGAAAGMDIPYEFFTGDMAKVNDRVMRVIINEYHRILEQSQWHLTVPQVSQPVREAFIEVAVLSGALDAPGFENNREDYFATAWGPPRWDYLHPVQDVEADGLEIKLGLSSRKRKVAERGESVEEIDRENAEDKERADSLGLKYETEIQNADTGGNDAPPEDQPQDQDKRSQSAAKSNRPALPNWQDRRLPLQQAPSVTVNQEPAQVTVNQAPTNVTVPIDKLNIEAPKTEVTVVTPPRRIVREVTERDAEGRIKRIEEKEIDQ